MVPMSVFSPDKVKYHILKQITDYSLSVYSYTLYEYEDLGLYQCLRVRKFLS